ncbi:MAG: beta-galactosidase trimerization domain-containing protein [Verrucomicrobia bacterium]|nr:beta-galactosidase trimerization domain-containing protein [Verrucomicrobiota bacterium]
MMRISIIGFWVFLAVFWESAGPAIFGADFAAEFKQATEKQEAIDEHNARGEVLVEDIKYTYDREPENDPDHTALIEGKGVGPWAFTLTTDVTFDLRTAHELSSIEMDISRGNLNWGLKDMTLFIMDRAGDFKEVGKVATGWKLGYPGEPGPTSFAFTNINKSAQQLRLRFNNDGWYFGVNAVRIYAKKPQPIAPPAAIDPKADAGALTPYNIPDTGDALVFKKGNFDKDPEDELLLANKYVKLVIKPSIGGVIASFRYKGMDFTQPKVPSAPGGGGGFLADNINAQGGGDWWEAPYQYKLLENTADRISLQLWATGKTGPCAYLTVYKTITLHRDRSDVQVDWDYQLSKGATAAIPFRLLYHNFVGTREGIMKSKNFSYFAPGDDGVVKLDYGKPAGIETWWNNPARGWVGVADRQHHTGIAFLMDYRYLKLFYSWGSGHHNGLPTLEWLFNDITIPDGGSFKTSAAIVPFQGMDEIAGVGGGVVANLKWADNKIAAMLLSGKNQDVAAILRARVLPYGEWKTIADEKLSLKTDEPLPLAAAFTPARNGTHVFSLVLKKDDKELLNTELARVFGKASGKYVFKPTEERIVEAGAKVKTNYTSMDCETPHVKWARPYHGGKTKALILVDGRYGREVIELAQRMDLDFDTTYLFPTDTRESMSDYYGRTSVGDLKAGLARLLGDNPDWDVLVMAGHMFKYFTAEQQAVVQEKVQAGSGLVVVQPDSTEPLPGLSPLLKRGAMSRVPWKKKKDHFITNGIPFEALPATDVYSYPGAEGAEVLADAGGNPLVATRSCGKGRVVAFGYRSGDPRDAAGQNEFFGLIPNMAAVGRGEEEIAPPPIFSHWEYHFSLLCKAVLWAAKKEPVVMIEKIDASRDTVKIVCSRASAKRGAGGEDADSALHKSAAAQPVTVEMKIQDKYGNALGGETKKVDLKKDKSEIVLPIKNSLRHGVNLFDIWLRDPRGKVINWASAALQVNQPLKIAEVKDGKSSYSEGDAIELDVKLDGAISKDGMLTTRIRDGFDRLLIEKETPVASNVEKLSFMLKHPVNRLMIIETELTRGKERLDIHEFHRTVTFPIKKRAHEGDPINLAWNNLTIYGLNTYLIEPFIRLTEELGFNSALSMQGDVDKVSTYHDAVRRRNMVIEGRSGGLGNGVPAADSKPEHPTMQYCVNNPRCLADESAAARAQVSAPGADSTQYGDEYVHSNGTDFCFCGFCLPKLRQWLKTQYADLKQLNLVWGARFEAWDLVRPLTMKESLARGDKNFASWADHRAFNDISVAEYFNEMRLAVEREKPGARFGLCGNFGPNAYSGEDDWLLRKSLTLLQAYGGFDELNCWQDESNDIEMLKWGQFQSFNSMRFNIYYHMFFGMNGMAVCGTQRLPNFDWTLSGCAKGYKEFLTQLNRGIGRLLNESRRTPQPVAMHYAHNNAARAALILGQGDLWANGRWQWRNVMDHCGFDNGWISYEQLAAGKTQAYKVIYLPMSCSLSDKEVASLKKFVEEGGMLIGQLAIGLVDGHCRFTTEGSLDKVFGIHRKDSKIAKTESASVRKEHHFGSSFPEMPLAYLETGLHATSAEVLAVANNEKVPVAFGNNVGKGLAIYLACDFAQSFENLRNTRDLGDHARAMDECLRFITHLHAKAGVKQVLDIVDESGHFPPHLKLVDFKNGDIHYYGILREYDLAKSSAKKIQKVKIKFPVKGRVHEIFSDRDYGLTDGVDTAFVPTTLQLYSVLPYEVSDVAVNLANTEYAAGEAVRYDVEVKAKGKVGTHILRLSVIDPSDAESKPYSVNLTSRDGKASGSFPLALNDKKGRWKLVAKDLASGKEGATSFVVR